MRKKTVLTLGGVTAAAALISGAGLAAASTTTTTAPAGEQTIALKATQASLTCIPVPGQKPGPEVPCDQCVFSERLTRDGKSYGHDAVHCTVVTSNDLMCTAAWMLPRGQIAVAGDGGSTTGARKIIPVVGGTRAYQGIRGDVVITSTGGSTSRVVFHLLP
jgi:hypothetical protein